VRRIPIRFDQELSVIGVSSPEAVELFLPAYDSLPKRVLQSLPRMVKSIEVVTSDRIDELFHEGIVLDVPGHRNAFWDSGRRIVYVLSPEELSIDAPGALLHEFGHVFWDSLSPAESEMVYEATAAGERSSDHPSTDDEEENFAEAFRVFYSGFAVELPDSLSEIMRSFDGRAKSATDWREFAEGR
jgi:hypothetical protein